MGLGVITAVGNRKEERRKIIARKQCGEREKERARERKRERVRESDRERERERASEPIHMILGFSTFLDELEAFEHL